ncbi:MAG: AraC family transcriptional regulator [Proteobacteria bacterium]|nr:AraC family transcriptional regulator [Pseudomonadota bacterium]
MDRQAEFAALIEQYTNGDGMLDTALPRVSLAKLSKPSEPMHGVHQPALCIIAQGRKQVILGDSIYFYDASQYLVASVDVPVVGQVIEATPERPYLSFKLNLDPHLISELILETGLTDDVEREAPSTSLSLATVTPELLDAVIRMLRLLESPRDIAVLGPLAEREILYRLLNGPDAARLRQIAQVDSKLQRVTRAISWIKQHFTEPFSIELLASEARMSTSALHHHFKQVTAMSPLQYQKQLRLQEARRLILIQGSDAASAGHLVGYESPSQFSREYSRLFGAPPLRDANRLKALPGALVPA